MTGNLLYDLLIAALCLFGLAVLMAGEYVEQRDKRKGIRR